MQPCRLGWVEEWCNSAARQQRVGASRQDPAAEDHANAAGKWPPLRYPPGFPHPMSERGGIPSNPSLQHDEAQATRLPAPKPAPDSLSAPEAGSDNLSGEEWQHLDSLSEVMQRKPASVPPGRGRRCHGYRRPHGLRSESGAAAPPVSLMAECPREAGDPGFQQARLVRLCSEDLELPWPAGSSQRNDM